MANKRGDAAKTAAQIRQSANGGQSPNINTDGDVSVSYGLNEEKLKDLLQQQKTVLLISSDVGDEEKLYQIKAIEEKQDAIQQGRKEQVQSSENTAEASEQGGVKRTEEFKLTEKEFSCLGILLFIGGCFGFQCADGFFQSAFLILIGGVVGGLTFVLYADYFEDFFNLLVEHNNYAFVGLILSSVIGGCIGAHYANSFWQFVLFFAVGAILGNSAGVIVIVITYKYFETVKFLIDLGVNKSIIFICGVVLSITGGYLGFQDADREVLVGSIVLGVIKGNLLSFPCSLLIVLCMGLGKFFVNVVRVFVKTRVDDLIVLFCGIFLSVTGGYFGLQYADGSFQTVFLVIIGGGGGFFAGIFCSACSLSEDGAKGTSFLILGILSGTIGGYTGFLYAKDFLQVVFFITAGAMMSSLTFFFIITFIKKLAKDIF